MPALVACNVALVAHVLHVWRDDAPDVAAAAPPASHAVVDVFPADDAAAVVHVARIGVGAGVAVHVDVFPADDDAVVVVHVVRIGVGVGVAVRVGVGVAVHVGAGVAVHVGAGVAAHVVPAVVS